MKSPVLPYIVREFLWQPTLYLPTNHLGYLVQPGSTQPPQTLSPGWNWHWPILTVIRLLPLDPLTYYINQEHSLVGDDPIVAVTKDHHLVAITGLLRFRINPDASAKILAKISKHTVSRQFRPLIRQQFRQSVAEYNLDQLTCAKLQRAALKPLKTNLSQLGFTAMEVTITGVNLVKLLPALED